MKQLAGRTWRMLVRRIGYSGVAGCLALLAAAALAAALPTLQRDTRDAVASMAERSAARARVPVALAPASPADAVRAYVGSFPALRQNAADLAQVFAAAELRHVALPKGEYQLKVEPNAPFTAYTATFPIHGDYETLKGFGSDVLTALPHVSMDELRISRDSAGSATLDAVVRFTFYYRST